MTDQVQAKEQGVGDDGTSAGSGEGRKLNRRALPMQFIIVMLWLTTVFSVTAIITKYSLTPSGTAATPQVWPEQSGIILDTSRPTLIMFAHPKCPCTRASIGELGSLMARNQGRLTARVLFLKPEGTTADWAETDLWRKAAAIPGVVVQRDAGGKEARAFGGEASGWTVLYDAGGRLLFQGGITKARGHSGDNVGRTALSDLLANHAPANAQTPVFGCPLFESATDLEATECQR